MAFCVPIRKPAMPDIPIFIFVVLLSVYGLAEIFEIRRFVDAAVVALSGIAEGYYELNPFPLQSFMAFTKKLRQWRRFDLRLHPR